MDTTPNEFICPITLKLMCDPVLCEDGYTYERKAIMGITNSLSPMTRQPINKYKLISNRALKDSIDRFKLSKHNEENSSQQNYSIFEEEQQILNKYEKQLEQLQTKYEKKKGQILKKYDKGFYKILRNYDSKKLSLLETDKNIKLSQLHNKNEEKLSQINSTKGKNLIN